VSSVTESGTRSSSKGIAVVLAILGVLAIIVAIIYMTVAAKSLPGFLPGHIAGSSGHHPLRAGTALIVGLILLALAWWVGRRGKSGSASSS
jgi:hypothetical protein